MSPSGAGVFRWTPLAADVGEHSFDFTVSDGGNDTTVTINDRRQVGDRLGDRADVPPAARHRHDDRPRRRRSASTSTSWSRTRTPREVTIAQEEPVIEGATLDAAATASTAMWHWCPTKEQEAETRYTLVLVGRRRRQPEDAQELPRRAARRRGGTNCPGARAGRSRTRRTTQTTISTSTLDATSPTTRASRRRRCSTTRRPTRARRRISAQMTQLSTLEIDGTTTERQLRRRRAEPGRAACRPAPRATLYYVFVADDDDDDDRHLRSHDDVAGLLDDGDRRAARRTAGMCATCTADAQCGTGDLCVYVGSMGDSTACRRAARAARAATPARPSRSTRSTARTRPVRPAQRLVRQRRPARAQDDT